jgi:hypothetical protein
MAETEELWSILLPNGEVRTGTLDELDEAFNAGAVDASTLVLAPGATEWSTIGALACIDDHAIAPSRETLRPVVFDDDEPEPAPPPRSRVGWIVAATATALAIGVGVFAGAMGTSSRAKDDPPKAAATPPIATIEAIATTAPEPAIAVASAAPAPSSQPAAEPSDTAPRLTEDQKKALVETGKIIADRTKINTHGASAAPQRARATDDPFAKRSSSKGKCSCAPGDPLCSCL